MSRGAEWSYMRTRSRNLPPSRVVVGTPKVLPARSQRAISMPLTARISMCAEPSVRHPRPVDQRIDAERILADQLRLQRRGFPP